MQVSATNYEDNLKNTKVEIADMNRKIMRYQSEIDKMKGQVSATLRLSVNMYLSVYLYNTIGVPRLSLLFSCTVTDIYQ